MQAVLIIDMIEDFVNGKLGFPKAKDIVPNIRKLIDAARKKKIPLIYVCDSHRPGDPELNVWGEHAMEGQPGSQVIKELAPAPGEAVLKKHTYSAFFETGLHGILQGMGVKEVVLTGVVTNICIQHSAADAHFRGYRVTVVNDCTAAVEEATHQQTLETIRQLYGARIVKSEDLISEWEGRK